MCLLLDDKGRILVSKGYDKIKNEHFYRVLGGSLNEGENPEDGVRREIREELNSEIERLKFLTQIDNKFVFEDKEGHEIVNLFQGELVKKELESVSDIHIVEDHYEFDACWIPISDIFEGKAILYPSFDYKTLLLKLA